MNKSLNAMILLTGFGFTALAVAMDLILESVDLTAKFLPDHRIWASLIIASLCSGMAAIFFNVVAGKLRLLRELDAFSRDTVARLNPSMLQILAISLAAGWGEEILFRGVLQEVLGGEHPRALRKGRLLRNHGHPGHPHP